MLTKFVNLYNITKGSSRDISFNTGIYEKEGLFTRGEVQCPCTPIHIRSCSCPELNEESDADDYMVLYVCGSSTDADHYTLDCNIKDFLKINSSVVTFNSILTDDEQTGIFGRFLDYYEAEEPSSFDDDDDAIVF